MDSQTISDRLQLVATIGVIVGLALVIWELRQQREFAQAEMTSQSFFLAVQQNSVHFGDRAIAPILLRSCRTPEDLEEEDIALLLFYANDRFLPARRLYALERRSDLYGEQWRYSARSAAEELFSIPLLRAYWRAGLFSAGIPDLEEEVDAYLTSATLQDCSALLDEAGRIARGEGATAAEP